MGATALINGVNSLSISTDIQFGESATQYSFTNGFSHTPSSIRSDSPSQISSATPAHQQELQHIPSLEQHLAHNGIPTPKFPDVTIHLANFPPISAHAIFLSRSPYLNSLLENQPPSPPYTLNLPNSDPNLTYDSLINTLQLFYTPGFIPTRSLTDSSSIVAHIAAACTLGIFPSTLVDTYRSNLLKINLTPENILPFINFLLSIPHHTESYSQQPGPYPPFTTGLMQNVITYFLTQLPIQLQSSTAALPPTANTESYKTILQALPFELLKHILEHPQLPIGSEKQRYELAKTVVAKRAKVRKATGTTGPGGNMEESVVLKVGGRDGGGVQLLQSYRRKAVYKVSANGTAIQGGRSRNSTTGSK